MAPPVVIARDVTSTVAEFDASLRSAVRAAAGALLSGAAPRYRVQNGDVRLEIVIAAGPERRIALMRLPTLLATYTFTGGSADAQRALLAKLDRAMHRGGG